MVKQSLRAEYALDGWKEVPFPAPLHSVLDYIYTLDRDADIFTITRWDRRDGELRPIAHQISLPMVRAHKTSDMRDILLATSQVLARRSRRFEQQDRNIAPRSPIISDSAYQFRHLHANERAPRTSVHRSRFHLAFSY